MANYNQRFNSDDSVIRHIIIGFLADLNAKLYFHRQISNSERVTVDVPFYYSITGDDQFLRDQFLFSTASGPNCTPDKANADANYDAIPRGIVNFTGIDIDSSKLVNKRTMGNYTKMNSEGIIESYVAEFDMIPITISFDIEILVSSTLDSFKITEAIIKRMYKSNYFNVEVGHLEEGNYRISSYYALPEDYSLEKPVGFTYDDKDRFKITFPIEVNSFIPSFYLGNEQGFGSNQLSTEQFAGNRMFTINSILNATDINEIGGAQFPGEVMEVPDFKGPGVGSLFGPQGFQGEQGIQGPQGPGTLTSVSAEMVNPSQIVTVTNPDTTPNIIIDDSDFLYNKFMVNHYQYIFPSNASTTWNTLRAGGTLLTTGSLNILNETPVGVLFTTPSAQGSVAGFYGNNFGNISYFGTNFDFDFSYRFKITSSNSAQRFFAGLSNMHGTVAPSNIEPDLMINSVGVAKLQKSSNLHFIWNDSTGTASTLDLGSDFLGTDTNSTYRIRIFKKSGIPGLNLELTKVTGGGTTTKTSTTITSDYNTNSNHFALIWMGNSTVQSGTVSFKNYGCQMLRRGLQNA